MEKNVPTILKSLLQSCSQLGLAYPVLPFTTLNQKLNIQAAAQLNPGEMPIMNCFMIGNGGLEVATGGDGTPYIQAYRHKPTDSGLFSELPFIVRPTTSDLSDLDRSKYRLRRLITISSQPYFAYYAKVLDFGSSVSQLQNRVVAPDGSITVSPFNHTNDNLNPEPIVLAAGDTVTVTGNYVSASTLLTVVLNADDISEIVNAATLIYGDANRANISELALCSSVNRNVSTSAGGFPVTYTEAIATQVMSFLSTLYPAANLSEGVEYEFDIGKSEPLLAVS